MPLLRGVKASSFEVGVRGAARTHVHGRDGVNIMGLRRIILVEVEAEHVAETVAEVVGVDPVPRVGLVVHEAVRERPEVLEVEGVGYFMPVRLVVVAKDVRMVVHAVVATKLHVCLEIVRKPRGKRTAVGR